MRAVILQHDIVWCNPEANRRRLEQQLLARQGADLYVLCEMWPTGFATEPEGTAERDGTSLEWMRQMAHRLDAAVCGSIATEEGGHYYNRLYFVKPTGEACHYDKHHLFTYGGEHLHFTRGERRVVVEWRGVRLLLQVCYDLRFPVWSRNHWDAGQPRPDYDAAIYVASWPTPRVEAWSALLRARAIENQCYVLGVNRVGSDPDCTYCGASAIIDPYGRTLAECEHDRETCTEACLDMEALEAFRAKFPVLKDDEM